MTKDHPRYAYCTERERHTNTAHQSNHFRPSTSTLHLTVEQRTSNRYIYPTTPCLSFPFPTGDEVSLTPESTPSSPELTKRSWFGTLMGSERDETYTILVKGKPLASVKADLIHAFLSVSIHPNAVKFLMYL